MYSETEHSTPFGGAMVATVRPMRALRLRIAAACVLALLGSLAAADAPRHDVIGVVPDQLAADYWIARARAADEPVLDRAAIAAQNERLVRNDPSVNDLAKIPASLDAAQVRAWIEGISRRPDGALFGRDGERVPETTLRALERSLALEAIPAKADARFGLVVRRAPLRAFPTLE